MKRMLSGGITALTVSTGLLLFAQTSRETLPTCDPDNGGLKLAAGFCALVAADNLGIGRHMVVAPNGDLFVSIRNRDAKTPGYVVGLRDTNGDGKKVGDCDKYPAPLAAFPGHWAPGALLFYSGAQFPKKYQGGAFIAFQGSWNRAPEPQGGYKVVLQPFDGPKASGSYEVFADGFAGVTPLMKPEEAKARPAGLAQAPDGSLFISDMVNGRIWRVMYRGGHPHELIARLI